MLHIFNRSISDEPSKTYGIKIKHTRERLSVLYNGTLLDVSLSQQQNYNEKTRKTKKLFKTYTPNIYFFLLDYKLGSFDQFLYNIKELILFPHKGWDFLTLVNAKLWNIVRWIKINIIGQYATKIFAWPHHVTKKGSAPLILGWSRHFLLKFLYQPGKLEVTYLCARDIDFSSFYDFTIVF